MNGGVRWLTVLVAVHVVISMVHGFAHDGARIHMSLAANLFIFIVILAGPVAGIALAWWRPAAGGWLIATTMLASLVFGVVNHFVLESPDHVTRVASDWRTLFTVSALLLALSEALGAGLAFHIATAARISGQPSKQQVG